MTNYIIQHNNAEEHYFYKPYEGLCMRQKRNHTWKDHQVLYKESLDHFGVFLDHNQTVHILSANAQGQFIYLKHKNGTWSQHVLAKLNPDVQFLRVKFASVNGQLCFLYTVRHAQEILLVHCVLGDHAKPSTIGRLLHDDFFIFDHRVYYTNSENVLGYQDLTDGKTDRFNPVCNGAVTPYILDTGAATHLAYKKGDALYFENNPVYTHKYAENPILVENNGRLMLLWQDGNFVRYIMSLTGGKTWSTPMQFVNPGKNPELYYVQRGDTIYHYFGNRSAKDLHIFGTNDLFSPQQSKTQQHKKPQSAPNLETLALLLKKAHTEISMLRQELSALKQELMHLQNPK